MSVLNSNIVEATILKIQASAKDSKSARPTIMNKIMNEMEINPDEASNVYNAIYYACIRNNDGNCDEAESCAATGATYKAEIHNLTFYGQIQHIMDQVCWSARGLALGRGEADKVDASPAGSTGLDFTQDIADVEYGKFDTTSIQAIKNEVLEIYRHMTIVAATLTQIPELKLWSVEPLSLFAPSVCDDDGNWSTPVTCNDWDHAMSCMDELADANAERKKALQRVTTRTAPDFGTTRKYTITRKADKGSGPASKESLDRLVAKTDQSIEAKRTAYAQANRESVNGTDNTAVRF